MAFCLKHLCTQIFIVILANDYIFYMKSILIPSNFSVQSAVSFNYAVEIACLSGAKLVLLHAYHIPVLDSIENTGSPIASLLDVTDGIAPEAFTEAVKKAHAPEVLESIEFEYVYTPKLNAESIIDLHKKRHFDLIISESRPQNKLYDLIFGNYTDELIDGIKNIPLMIIPFVANFKNIKNILYLTAMLAPNETLVSMRNFVSMCHAKIDFLHVKEEQTRSYPQKAAAFKERATQVFEPIRFNFIEMENSNIEDTIFDFINTHQPQPDLIAMVERPKKNFDRLFINSLTKTMALRAPIPVVIFHEPNR